MALGGVPDQCGVLTCLRGPVSQPFFNPVTLGAIGAAVAVGAVTGATTKSKKAAAVGALAGAGAVLGYFKIIDSGKYLSFISVREGSQGAAARMVQKRLNMHGYGPLAETGVFDAASAAAIRRFQRARGVPDTGVAAGATWTYLTERPRIGIMEYKASDLIKAMKRLGYTIFDDGRWNIVGIRSPAYATNAFDDELHIFRKLKRGWEDHAYPVTTDPGFFWLKNPMNTSGTAAMVPGQYPDSHGWGRHKGAYEALVQVGNVKVYRDRSGGDKYNYDPNSIITGKYGINIHKAGTSSTNVDKWSAGCQVFARERDFQEFLNLLKESGQKTFTYTLLNADQISRGLLT